jgi:16S rRNA (uracil1498-N3)-methyltransferase
MEPLFYAPDIAAIPELPEDESQHCMRVLRLKTDDLITITDGKGFFYTASIVNVHSKHCQVKVMKQWSQLPTQACRIHIGIAPTKNMERMEWFVEKATEIGIETITPLYCCHSERKEIKLQRLYKIAVSAMKQSQKASLPQINEMIDFQKFISQDFIGVKMIAHCATSHRQPVKNIYKPNQQALILIGPEGDFSYEEINAALFAGYASVSLGESKLRTETAALVACHTVHLLNQ